MLLVPTLYEEVDVAYRWFRAYTHNVVVAKGGKGLTEGGALHDTVVGLRGDEASKLTIVTRLMTVVEFPSRAETRPALSARIASEAGAETLTCTWHPRDPRRATPRRVDVAWTITPPFLARMQMEGARAMSRRPLDRIRRGVSATGGRICCRKASCNA
jgi:hypothetical protein